MVTATRVSFAAVRGTTRPGGCGRHSAAGVTQESEAPPLAFVSSGKSSSGSKIVPDVSIVPDVPIVRYIGGLSTSQAVAEHASFSFSLRLIFPSVAAAEWRRGSENFFRKRFELLKRLELIGTAGTFLNC